MIMLHSGPNPIAMRTWERKEIKGEEGKMEIRRLLPSWLQHHEKI